MAISSADGSRSDVRARRYSAAQETHSSPRCCSRSRPDTRIWMEGAIMSTLTRLALLSLLGPFARRPLPSPRRGAPPRAQPFKWTSRFCPRRRTSPGATIRRTRLRGPRAPRPGGSHPHHHARRRHPEHGAGRLHGPGRDPTRAILQDRSISGRRAKAARVRDAAVTSSPVRSTSTGPSPETCSRSRSSTSPPACPGREQHGRNQWRFATAYPGSRDGDPRPLMVQGRAAT